MKKTRVLFLGTANATRSQMAEAYLRMYAGETFEAYSAGLEPTEINSYTTRVMNEVGISLDGQSAKDVSVYLGQLHFGYLITVCADADRNCPTTFPDISQRLHWALENPARTQGTDEEMLAMFRQVRDEIDERIKDWLRETQPQIAAAAAN